MPKKAASKKGSAAKKDGKNGDKPHWGHGRKGPRSQIWKGSLSFGLVSVPVALAAAARDHDFRFRQLHAEDLAPIEQRRYCSAEDIEVSWDEIGRAYELSEDEGGGLVVLTDEELASAAPERTETIEIEAFIDAADVDPIQLDRPYHLTLTGTSDGDRRAYRLLLEAMEASERAAIGRMVMRSREYLVLVRPHDGILDLTTLHFHDEVRSYEDIPAGEGVEAPETAVRSAVAIIEELSVEWQPEDYKDHFRERIAAMIKERRREHRESRKSAKAKGKGREGTVAAKAKQPTEAPDLMAALSRALDEAQGRRGGRERRRAPGAGKAASQRKQQQVAESLERLSRDELYDRAQKIDLPGRSRMTKEELRKALEKHR